MSRRMLDVNIGGTGIKGAIVDLDRGVFVGERIRRATPHPATPDKVSTVVADITHYFAWQGPLGCTLPAIVKGGVALTAANIDSAWIKAHAAALQQARQRHCLDIQFRLTVLERGLIVCAALF